MGPPQQGDEAALFESYNDELVRTVRGSVNTSLANVEDACAFAWAQFLRYQPDRDRNWRGWLYRVASREARRSATRESRLRFIGQPDPSDPHALPELPDPKPAPQMQRLELQEALETLSRVPQRRREAAALRMIGLRYDEIADVLGISATRVNALLAEANVYIRADVLSREPLRSDQPRVARLHELEHDTPEWLSTVIGPAPSAQHPTVLLAWRRAALALDDYRSGRGDEPNTAGLGDRPEVPEDARRFDRAVDAIEGLRTARAPDRTQSLER
jgi:RNA polymerase sigma factor (sigma-70 family)